MMTSDGSNCGGTADEMYATKIRNGSEPPRQKEHGSQLHAGHVPERELCQVDLTRLHSAAAHHPSYRDPGADLPIRPPTGGQRRPPMRHPHRPLPEPVRLSLFLPTGHDSARSIRINFTETGTTRYDREQLDHSISIRDLSSLGHCISVDRTILCRHFLHSWESLWRQIFWTAPRSCQTQPPHEWVIGSAWLVRRVSMWRVGYNYPGLMLNRPGRARDVSRTINDFAPTRRSNK